MTPLSPVSGANTGGYLVQILDITESKQNLLALEESRNRFEILFDGISDAIFIQDAVGHILDVNREACVRLGYSRREMLTLSVSDFDPDHQQVESVQERTSRILQSGPMKFESRHRTRNGEIIHVELKSSRFRHDGKDFFVTIARDITDRKQMEKALKESKKKLNAILNSLPDMVIEIDSGMTILWANTDLAMDEIEKTDAVFEFLSEIKDACRKGKRVDSTDFKFQPPFRNGKKARSFEAVD